MLRMNGMVPEAVFEKYPNIRTFFACLDYTPRRFNHLYGMNINDLEISPLERTVIIAGIKSYLKQNDFKLSDTTLETLNIQGITENELMAAPNLRCGSEQTGQSPQCMSIEHNLIEAIFTHKMVFSLTDSSEFLSRVLLGDYISKEGAKFLGKVLLQEPHLILRILQYHQTAGDTIFKEITENHIIESLKLKPEIAPEFKKDPIFKLFNVKNSEELFNVVLSKVSQRSRKKEDEFLLEAAVDVLRLTGKIANVFNITANIKNDTKYIGYHHDINQKILEYLPAQDIISFLEMAIESLNLINNSPGSSHEPIKLKHQMSTLGLEDQESSCSSSILPAEPLMNCDVTVTAETRKFS